MPPPLDPGIAPGMVPHTLTTPSGVVLGHLLVRHRPVFFPAVAVGSALPTPPVGTLVGRPAPDGSDPQVVHLPALRPRSPVPLGDIKYLNPTLAKRLTDIAAPRDGVPREQVTLPVSPSTVIGDELPFEHPTGPERFYLPRYRLAEQVVSGRSQFRFALSAAGTGWELTAWLEAYPAAAVAEVARTAAPLPHEVGVAFQARIPIGGGGWANKEWEFQEVTAEPPGVRVVLRVETVGERDQLYAALTDPEADSRLLVRRKVTVAVPRATNGTPAVVLRAGGGSIPLPPVGSAVSFDLQDTPGDDATFALLTPTSWRVTAAARGDVAYAGQLDPDLLSHDDLEQIVMAAGRAAFEYDTRTDAPGNGRRVFVVRTRSAHRAMLAVTHQPDRVQTSWVTYRTIPTFVMVEWVYRVVTQAVECTVGPLPFSFPPALHGYAFAGITATSPGTAPGLIRRQVGPNVYFQDQASPDTFYYLPDAFKLGRRPEGAHPPTLSVTFEPGDGGQVGATVEYVAVPVVEPQRLTADAPALTPPGGPLPRFAPLLVDPHNLRYRLALPGAAGGPFHDRPDVGIDLRTGLYDRLTLSLAEFQQVFDAMLGGGAVLFQGQVSTDLGGAAGGTLPGIPFTGRLSDTAGDLLVVERDLANPLRFVVRNVIESAVRITRPTGSVEGADGARVHAPATGPALPLTLPPGVTASFDLTPPNGTTAPLFDPGPIEVLPNRDALFAAVINPATPAEFRREVSVRVSPELFGTDLQSILVEFQRGADVEFQRGAPADRLTTSCVVFADIADLILRRSDGTYRYKLSTVTTGGRRFRHAEFRPATADILRLVTADLPTTEG